MAEKPKPMCDACGVEPAAHIATVLVAPPGYLPYRLCDACRPKFGAGTICRWGRVLSVERMERG